MAKNTVDDRVQVGHSQRVTKSVTAKIRMSPTDRDTFARAAEAMGVSFSSWAIVVMKKAARSGKT